MKEVPNLWPDMTEYIDSLKWPPGYFEFIQPIINDPKDFTTRLIYADWLEDQPTEEEQERGKRVRERVYYQQSVGDWETCPQCKGLGRMPIARRPEGFNYLDLPAVRSNDVLDLRKCDKCNGEKRRKKVYPIEWILGDKDA